MDPESPVDFYTRLKEELRKREWLEEGEVTVRGLARWCREVVGGRFGESGEFESLEELTEYLRVEFRIVDELSASFRASGALEGAPDGLDADASVREAAEHLAAVSTAPQSSAKTVFGWHRISKDPSEMRAAGRLERAHPLEFPMGIGGLYDDVRDDENSSLRSPSARVWAQHLLRLWGGSCVHGPVSYTHLRAHET